MLNVNVEMFIGSVSISIETGIEGETVQIDFEMPKGYDLEGGNFQICVDEKVNMSCKVQE